MFRSMRRQNKELSAAEREHIFEVGEYGVLACAGDEDFPYAVPVNYTYENGVFYFHSALNGHKLDAIQRNPKVSFCVVSSSQVLPELFSTAYKSAVAFGFAEQVFGEEKEFALKKLIEKYSSEFLQAGLAYIQRSQETTTVIKITVEHATAKQNRD